jgi:predicted site-specific integrase-resolvase
MAAMSTDPRLKRYTRARPIKPKRTPTQKAMDEERKRRLAMYDRCASAKTQEEKLTAYVERARARIQPRLGIPEVVASRPFTLAADRRLMGRWRLLGNCTSGCGGRRLLCRLP